MKINKQICNRNCRRSNDHANKSRTYRRTAQRISADNENNKCRRWTWRLILVMVAFLGAADAAAGAVAVAGVKKWQLAVTD